MTPALMRPRFPIPLQDFSERLAMLTMGEIVARHKAVENWAYLPKPVTYDRFAEFVLWSDGHQDDGSWLGHCPLCDPAKSIPGSAEFVFAKGVMRCHGEPSCHAPKRAMSLTNVWNRMQNSDC